MIRFLKGLFGFCQAKGCWKRHDVSVEMRIESGKTLRKAKICEDHLMALLERSTTK